MDMARRHFEGTIAEHRQGRALQGEVDQHLVQGSSVAGQPQPDVDEEMKNDNDKAE